MALHNSGSSTLQLLLLIIAHIIQATKAQCSNDRSLAFVITATQYDVKPTPSLTACLQTCVDDQDCVAVEFEAINEQCVVKNEHLTPGFAPKQGSTIAEKICVMEITEPSHAQCLGAFERHPQYLLVGYAEEIQTVLTLDECAERCLRSKTCQSAAFFPDDIMSNCVMNQQTKDTKPSLFSKIGDNERTVVDYLQRTQCNGVWEDWSQWSRCSSSSLEQTRFRRCSTGYDCPGQTLEHRDCLNNRGLSIMRHTGVVTQQPKQIKQVWQQWTHWTNCGPNTQFGLRTRIRKCLMDGTCLSDHIEAQTEPCTYVGPMNNAQSLDYDWTECYRAGYQIRVVNGKVEVRRCIPPGMVSDGVHPVAPPGTQPNRDERRYTKLYGWLPWSDWSMCHTNNSQVRHRVCTFSAGGDNCMGPDTESRPCVGLATKFADLSTTKLSTTVNATTSTTTQTTTLPSTTTPTTTTTTTPPTTTTPTTTTPTTTTSTTTLTTTTDAVTTTLSLETKLTRRGRLSTRRVRVKQRPVLQVHVIPQSQIKPHLQSDMKSTTMKTTTSIPDRADYYEYSREYGDSAESETAAAPMTILGPFNIPSILLNGDPM